MRQQNKKEATTYNGSKGVAAKEGLARLARDRVEVVAVGGRAAHDTRQTRGVRALARLVPRRRARRRLLCVADSRLLAREIQIRRLLAVAIEVEPEVVVLL